MRRAPEVHATPRGALTLAAWLDALSTAISDARDAGIEAVRSRRERTLSRAELGPARASILFQRPLRRPLRRSPRPLRARPDLPAHRPSPAQRRLPLAGNARCLT